MNKKMLGIASLLIVSVAMFATQATATEVSTTRDIEEFINTQGTYCIDNGVGGCLTFNPPNFVIWTDPNLGRLITVDYAGLESKFFQDHGISLGTSTEGTITERPLADGSAEVTVLLHTKKASTWVTEFDPTITFDPKDLSTYQALSKSLLFGHRPNDVINGKDFALGDSFLKVVFINTAPGAPIPDLVQLAFFPEPTKYLLSVSFNAKADGMLREAFGVPDGTPGNAEVVQKGLIFAYSKANLNSRVAYDAFPAERIGLNEVGK